ncbi:SRPBCC family protein [Paenibacillus qinlingensis]|uniref:SRPBCC family protein n=1 Tax=Paenibacillus qinlingensis TaxID=1837343 RepID=UPI0015672739|nr:SRPBCC family protein [Paenibacillus qinlingensis]NQX60020.1 SRPBCC family protein [Paenibacillus qinlingensis]
MPIIRIAMQINAPVQVCFNLARSIDIHMESTSQTKEVAINGRTSGLIEYGETVTWEATHFFVRQQLTSKITEFEPPYRFVDEMVSGIFQGFRHDHIFESNDNGTLMSDVFEYTSPFGKLGKVADLLFLRSYMERLLLKRNKYIKIKAEQGLKLLC